MEEGHNINMKINYKDIILRDYVESDIEDDIRWMTEEIAWLDWDAPWESKNDLKNFNAEEHRKNMLLRLQNKKIEDEFRYKFEIDTKEGVHLGGVNSYLNDENYNWKSRSEGGCLYTIGIGICESSYWYKGYGTQAYIAFIKYLLSNEINEIYTETWSGNGPMIKMGERIGFEICHRDINSREYKGQLYDELVFKLNLNKFTDFLNEYE